MTLNFNFITASVFTYCCRSDLKGAIVDGADFSNSLIDKDQQMVCFHIHVTFCLCDCDV